MLAAHLASEAAAAHPQEAVHHLTVERDLQASLEALASDRVTGLGPKLSVAIVVADEESGDILASVGSAGLFEDARDGHVDMTRAERSPGSTLKPLIYGLAFEAGLAHPESLIDDRPTGFGSYEPQNFDGFHRGTVTVREALTESLNVPAIIALNAVGPARLIARMKRAGVDAVMPDTTAPGLAVGLGGLGRHTARSRLDVRGDSARRHRGGAARRHRRRAGARCRRAGALTGRRLVCRRHPFRHAAAAQRLPRARRLQDGHLLRLPRRLGDRLRRQACSRRVGGAAGRHAGRGAVGHRPPRRRFSSRRSTISGRSARRCGPAPRAPLSPRRRPCRRRSATSASPATPRRRIPTRRRSPIRRTACRSTSASATATRRR